MDEIPKYVIYRLLILDSAVWDGLWYSVKIMKDGRSWLIPPANSGATIFHICQKYESLKYLRSRRSNNPRDIRNILTFLRGTSFPIYLNGSFRLIHIT